MAYIVKNPHYSASTTVHLYKNKLLKQQYYAPVLPKYTQVTRSDLALLINGDGGTARRQVHISWI